MNRIFNVIWSITKEKWVVVSEKVKSNGGVPKSSLLSIAVLTSVLAAGVPAYAIDSGALPAGGHITAGTGSIGSSGSRMTVNQSSQQMIANWSSFNIGTDASVQFIQPNVSATVLNRIADQNPSQILGSLSANGKVFLLNQSGIIFGKNARVDVGGLVASSLNMLDSDFLAAKYKFVNSGNAGKVLNQGSITVAPGGVVALIAPKVTNEGTITARSGSVALGAGNKVSVDFTGDGLITLTVDQGVIDALVENKGLVKADGGLVVMTASAADALSKSTVNNSGIIEANSFQLKEGRILLDAVGGMTTVSGTLDAPSADGKGGQVVATGDRVLVKDGAHLTASGATGGGEVLVGGNWQGKDTSIHQATGTIVERGALLEANATDTGDGGTVVAWSDVTNPLSVTRAYGTFEAQGGPNGGDGGLIETSGHWLDVAGIWVSASGRRGKAGLWLLDPWDVTISSVTSDIPFGNWSTSDPYYWTPVSGSNISVSSITGKLMGGTHVTVETGGSGSNGTDAGIIDIQTDIKLYSTAPITATLTLNAKNSIKLNNSVIGSFDSAVLNLELVTPGSVSGSGSIIGAGSTIFNVGDASTYEGTIRDGIDTNGNPLVRTLTKDGAGTLTLTAKNDYTGTTEIKAGAIRVSGPDAALGDGASIVTVDSVATLEFNDASIGNHLDLQGALSNVGGDNTYAGSITFYGSTKINSVTNAKKLTLSGSVVGNSSLDNLTFDGAGDIEVKGVLSGSGGLTKLGQGTLTLSGVNTYSGGTNLNGGTLSLYSAAALGATDTISFAGGTLQYTASNTTDYSSRFSKVDNQLFSIDTNNQWVTFGSPISSTGGSLTKLGYGTLTLSGVNTYSGGTNLNGGILSLESADALGTTGTISFGGGTLQYTANTTDYSDRFSTVANQLFSIDTYGQSITFASPISSIGGTLTKLGYGTLTLSGVNTYSGGTNLNGGTLSLDSADALGTTGTISFSGGTLQYTAHNTTDYSDRFSNLPYQSFSIDTNGQQVTFDSAISSPNGTLTKLGKGTLILTNANSYMSTTIDEGTLSVSNSSALGPVSSMITVLSDATLELDNISIDNPLSLLGTLSSISSDSTGSNIYGGNIFLLGTATINAEAGTLTLNKTISGPISPDAGTCSITVTGTGDVVVDGGITQLLSLSPIDLIMAGTGSLTLTNSVSNYTGKTIIKSGTLVLGASNVIPYSSNIEVDGGVFDIGSFSDSVGDVSVFGGSITGTKGILNGQSYTINIGSSSDTTISAILDGGDLSKYGKGTLTLSGENTYTGSTHIYAGAILVSNNQGLGPVNSDSRVEVYSGAALELDNVTIVYKNLYLLDDDPGLSAPLLSSVGSGDSTYNGQIYFSGQATLDAAAGTSLTLIDTVNTIYGSDCALTVSGKGNVSIDGIIDDTFSSSPMLPMTLTKEGTGKLTLTSANTYRGITTINDGIISIDKDTALGTKPLVTLTGQLVLNNGILETTKSFTLSSNRGITLMGVGTFSTAGTTTLTYDGIIDGTGGLTKDGTGTLMVTGANTYKGKTTIAGGTLMSGKNEVIADVSAVIVGSGATWNLNDFNETVGSIAGLGNITLGSGELTTGDTNSTTFSGIISGSGGLTKVGTGTLTLSGANGYSGKTTITGGMVTSGDNNVIADVSSVIVGSSGTWNLNDFSERVGSIAGSGNIMLGIGELTAGDSSSTTYSGIITGSGGLTKVGSGTLTLTGANTYTGPTMITGGWLNSGASEVIPNESVLYIGLGATWNLNSNTETVGSIYGSGDIVLGYGNLTTGVDATSTTYGGIISGFGSLRKVGAGTLTLSGPNTYTGSTNINGGAIRVSGDFATLGNVNSAWVEVFSGAALELDNVTIGNKELYLTNNNVSLPSPALRSVSGTNTYGGDIFLSEAATVSADSGTTLILSNPVYSLYGLSNQYLSCDLTVSGNGLVIFEGAIGNIASVPGQDSWTIPLDSFTGSHGTTLFLNGGSVTTTGSQTYNEIVTLGGNTILTGADISFVFEVKSDVTSQKNFSLTVSDLGTTTFGGSVGGSNAGEELSSLFIMSNGGTAINGGSVTTTGPQTYNDIVILGTNTSLKGSGITFDSTVQSDGTGNYSLTVYDPGITIFRGAVGGSRAGEQLLSLETYGTDPVFYGSVTTTGAQIYHDIVTMGSDIILIGQNITFDSTVQSAVSSTRITNFSLTVVDSGSTVFGGAVGGDGTVTGEKLSSLTISSVGDATLNGIQATGPISVVTSTGNLIVDGNISTVDTSAKAIQLNAGQDLAAGTATGGNIIINSGTISVGTGGIATLYTGSVSNSTGLTNLVGRGNFRYNSDEEKANYTKTLNLDLNAIYRENPSLEVALANESIQSIIGVQNNDPVTDLASLIALGYTISKVTVLTDNTTSVYASTRVDDGLLNSPPVIVDDLITVVSAHVDDVATTADEVESNLPGTTHVDDLPTLDVVTTPPASGVISGTGPSIPVAVPTLVLAGINTFNGGNPITAAVPNMHSEEISPNVQGDVIKNEADKYADLVQKVLMTGGAVLILGSGALLLGKKYTVSQAAFGKHANVYAHLDHGYQHLNSDVLPKESEQKREVSVRIHLDMGIQEVKVNAGSLVNSD